MKLNRKLLWMLCICLLMAFPVNFEANAQEESASDAVDTTGIPPAPPVNVQAMDKPNDNGHGIVITWEPSPDEDRAEDGVIGYSLYRSDEKDGDYTEVRTIAAGMYSIDYEGEVYKYEDQDDREKIGSNPNPDFLEKGKTYYYKIQTTTATGLTSEFSEPVSAAPRGDWFHTGKTSYFIAIIIYFALVLTYIRQAKKGVHLYIRPIGGIEAIDNAIGRATEMGRPILFVLGTGSAADIATIAGYTILARVAKKTAEYQIPVLVPVNEPVVMSVAQETVRAAYAEAGRPDLYDEKNIPYVTAMQFPYVAAVNGIMMREKTATNFYMGLFHAESLLLAETGATTGAIQIAGTDQPAQLPFFIAATDFTLIGEELYAASAYLSKEPLLLGPLKAQDYAKALIIFFVIIGTITLSLGWDFVANIFETSI
ncbi:MAG: hypothetical protein GF315_10515 [candidate division Zixibacteria bacterium]|nr:hypothetical protein [candidate division Zixibacteria bacterium]